MKNLNRAVRGYDTARPVEYLFPPVFDDGFYPCKKRLGACLIYPGSKERIAGKIMSQIYKFAPQARYFYDLFGGGFAMSAQALASNLRVTYNELKPDLPQMFDYIFRCAAFGAKHFNKIGKFDREVYDFCGRDEYMQIRAKYTLNEPLTAPEIIKGYIYSFGSFGVQKSYAFSKNETIKHAGHDLIFYPFFEWSERWSLDKIIKIFVDAMTFKNSRDDTEQLVSRVFNEFAKDEFGDWMARRKLYAQFMGSLEAICLAGFQSTHFKEANLRFLAKMSKARLAAQISEERPDLVKTAKDYASYRGRNDVQMLDGFEKQWAKNNEELGELSRLADLKNLASSEALQALEHLENLHKEDKFIRSEWLTIENKSYREFDFKNLPCAVDEAVIYLDPPYLRTDKQNTNYGYHSDFNRAEFIDYCEDLAARGFNVFVSESDGFDELTGWRKIWSGAKARGNTAQSKDASRRMMNEFLFKVEK